MDISERFDFRWAPGYRRAALPFGVTPARAWVEVTDEGFDARFGFWRVHTARSNITNVSITGPYAVVKTAGPARLGITDRGLTFASNGDHGVCLDFAQPVAGMEPTGRLRHPNLTVTVADVDGLAAALRSR